MHRLSDVQHERAGACVTSDLVDVHEDLDDEDEGDERREDLLGEARHVADDEGALEHDDHGRDD